MQGPFEPTTTNYLSGLRTQTANVVPGFYHPRQLADLPERLHFVTMVAKRQLLAICLLQPLLGRNARGFRRDALGEYTLRVCRKLSCARVTCGTRALRSNVVIWQ